MTVLYDVLSETPPDEFSHLVTRILDMLCREAHAHKYYQLEKELKTTMINIERMPVDILQECHSCVGAA